jgi:XRE family transcriptional regulator, regulator of sulfur utilization
MKLLSRLLVLLATAAIVAAQSPAQSPPAAAQPLRSMVIDWQALVPTRTPTGERRSAFDAPTATLERFHGHITTLNPGENTGPLHRHPQEELVIIKEGTLEVNIDGRKQIAGPGSMVFFAVNENENMTNVGTTPATYTVLQWFTPRTPKG